MPIDVGGERLAFIATATDEEVPAGAYLSAPTGSRGLDAFEQGVISAEGSDDAKAKRLWERTAELVGTEL